MKKAFGAILIAVILIVCVVTLTVQRGENAMLEFPERPAEGCTVMSLEITDGKAQTEVIGTYNVNENVLTIHAAGKYPEFLFQRHHAGPFALQGLFIRGDGDDERPDAGNHKSENRHPRRQNLLFAVFEGRNVLRGGIKHFYELKHPPDAFLA